MNPLPLIAPLACTTIFLLILLIVAKVEKGGAYGIKLGTVMFFLCGSVACIAVWIIYLYQLLS
jgi:hypothetical protein